MTFHDTKSEKGYRLVFCGKDVSSSLQVQDITDFPDLADSEILGEMILATVCGSDLHTFDGVRKEATPCILGHEGVIRVLKSRRKGIKEGQRLSFHIIDCCVEDKCTFCASGLEQKCENLFKYGHVLLDKRSPFNGCFASHIVLHKGTHVVPIPDSLSDNIVVPANCACATMVNAVGSIVTKRKENALIQGAGLLGLYGCALLKESGFKQVFCADIREERLSLVKKFGGIPLLSDEAYGKPNFYDVVIEVCGVASVIPSGIKCIMPGGTYVLVGLVHPNSALEITAEQLIRKCLTIRGIHNYGAEDLTKAIQFLDCTKEKYPYDILVSSPYTLKDLSLAFDEARKGRYPRIAVKP